MIRIDLEHRRDAFVLRADLTLATPGITALFGRSGCGKTTLVNLLAGLLRGARGHVEVDGVTWFDSARGVELPAEQRRVGYVFQDARLFPHYSVAGNLRYGERRARRADGEGLRFTDVVTLLGLEPLLDRRPATLSGGERQRVALGRALLARPRLLLLDEPLASLDAARRDEVLPYLEKLRDALAVPMIFVSHQFDEVLRLANDMAVMDAGRVVACGTPAAVSLHPALRAIVGPDAIGAVLSGPVVAVNSATGSARLDIPPNSLVVTLADARLGEERRVQIFARDVILATREPCGLSVRNCLHGVVARLVDDGDAVLVELAVGGDARIVARVTHEAVAELGLREGVSAWALVKAVSTRGHVY